jgi:hypothetical protein
LAAAFAFYGANFMVFNAWIAFLPASAVLVDLLFLPIGKNVQ